jgi:hypothetical protein
VYLLVSQQVSQSFQNLVIDGSRLISGRRNRKPCYRKRPSGPNVLQVHRPCLTMPSCSRDRKSWMRTIRARGMQEKAPSPRTEKVGQILDTTARARGMQERAPSTRTEKVGQILDMTHRWGKSHDPGLYAAFPWGGYAQSKGDAPSTAHSPITLPGGCLCRWGKKENPYPYLGENRANPLPPICHNISLFLLQVMGLVSETIVEVRRQARTPPGQVRPLREVKHRPGTLP